MPVWALLVFVDSHDHFADGEAYEAVDLPETPKQDGRGDDGAGTEGDCLDARDYLAHDCGRLRVLGFGCEVWISCWSAEA